MRGTGTGAKWAEASVELLLPWSHIASETQWLLEGNKIKYTWLKEKNQNEGLYNLLVKRLWTQTCGWQCLDHRTTNQILISHLQVFNSHHMCISKSSESGCEGLFVSVSNVSWRDDTMLSWSDHLDEEKCVIFFLFLLQTVEIALLLDGRYPLPPQSIVDH